MADVPERNMIPVGPTQRRDTQQPSGFTCADSNRDYREPSGLRQPRTPAAGPFPRKTRDSRRDPPPHHRPELSHRRDDSAPLPRMDFTWDDAVMRRVMPQTDLRTPAKQKLVVCDKPVKRKQPDTEAGGMETDSKCQRGVKEDPSPLHKLRFLIGDRKSNSFHATGFERVSQTTRVDAHTFMWNTEQGIFCRIPSNSTPVLALERDRGIYMQEIQRFRLYDSQ
ncbi:hypothetical protein B0H13DRAFT_2338825 [Mycena leptocephala]|nr:hypothetical protein B0H13DRAFT_2338825 [Mycena leptocephala]